MTVATRSRQARNMAAGPYRPVISSFKLHLNAEGKSPKTVRVYIEAVQWFAAAHLLARGGKGDWSAVTADDVREWMVYLLETYSDSYANNQYRALQAPFCHRG